MYVNPITRQIFNYATPIECGSNPPNIIELHLDADDGDFYVLTPDPLKREAPQMFKPTQIKTTKTPNTFTAQDYIYTPVYTPTLNWINFGIEYYSQNTQIQLSIYSENH